MSPASMLVAFLVLVPTTQSARINTLQKAKKNARESESATPSALTTVEQASSGEVSRYSYRSRAAKGKTMKATALGRSVLFDLRTLRGNKPCNNENGGSCVNRMMDLTSSYTIKTADIMAVGYTASSAKVFRAVIMGESGGKGGVINNWDNQLVSWGLFQAAGKAGTLAKLLCHLKDLPTSKGMYNKLFVANGIDVGVCSPSYKSALAITKSSLFGFRGEVVQGNVEGAKAMQFNMKQLGTFMIAGQFKELVAGQASYWKAAFLKKGVNQKVDVDGKTKLCKLVTSEWGAAVIARLYNWMPAWVRKWTNEFIKLNPKFKRAGAWRTNMHAFIDFWNKKRRQYKRKEYKHGSYPQFPGEVLSQSAGSFDAGCM